MEQLESVDLASSLPRRLIMKSLTAKNTPICRSCWERFSSFTRHIPCFNTVRGRPFVCALCRKGFFHRRSPDLHLENDAEERVSDALCSLLFECAVCRSLFARETHLQKHLRTHTEEMPFSCDICLKAFAGKTALKRHKLLHVQERPIKCDVCLGRLMLKLSGKASSRA